MSADVRETHRKKLENLGVSGSIAPCDPDKVIFNFSSAVLSLKLKKLLAFGLDIGMPVFKLNYIKYFLSFEKIANYLQNMDCIGDRTEFKEILRMTANKFFYAFKPSKIFSVMTREDVKLLKEFSSNKNILVTKPDKGRGIVIVDRSHYVEGVSKIIENSSKFELITEEIKRVSRQAEDRINTFLLDIKKLKYISTALYNRLHVTGSGPGILYGLPKVHKPRFLADKLYRPIFAAYNCANFNISKFLVDILTPISENEYTLKNSTDFRQQIEKFSNTTGFIMASFDVSDLYTNVPLAETIDICLDLLSGGSVFGLPANIFRKLLEISVYNSMFCFNGKYYRQIDGLGMGLPLSPTLANIFLCFHEKNWLRDCPPSFKPSFYRRYMDDTFMFFREKSHIEKFLQYMNNRHKNIKFTCEIENDNQLSFLDCKIKRVDQNFNIEVYRKPYL